MPHIHVTPSGDGSFSGADWDNAFNASGLFAYWLTAGGIAAGDNIYIKGGLGTYTLTENIVSSVTGSTTAPINFIGVGSGTTAVSGAISYSDWALDDADRPFFDCGAYDVDFNGQAFFRNLSFELGAAYGSTTGAYVFFENCKFHHDYGAEVVGYGIICGGYSIFINCEFISDLCRAVYSAYGAKFINCYFHDCLGATHGYGIEVSSYAVVIYGCIFNNIKVFAIYLGSVGGFVAKNTFYNCSKDTDGTGYSYVQMNNIHEGTTAWANSRTSALLLNYYDGEHGDDARCTDMWRNLPSTIDNNTTSGDPLFTNPSGVVFTLQAGSPCLGTAEDISLGV